MSLGSSGNAIIRSPLEGAFIPESIRKMKPALPGGGWPGQRGLLCCASYGHGVQAGVYGEAFAGGVVLQEAQQGILGLQPGAFMFHIDEVAGVTDRGEVAVVDVLGHQAGVGGGGVFVEFAVDEQQRDVDIAQAVQVAVGFHAQHLLYVGVHLPVFVAAQAAGVFVVVAFEQGWQVLADGVVDQVADLVAIFLIEAHQGAAQVVEHRLVEDRRERREDGLFQGRRALGEGEHGGHAAPGKRHHVLGLIMVDQVEQDRRFVFLADAVVVAVVRPRLAGVGLVEEHHVELGGEVFDRLREGGGGRQRAVDQDDGLLGLGVGVKLRVYLVRPVHIDDSDCWLHMYFLLAQKMNAAGGEP